MQSAGFEFATPAIEGLQISTLNSNAIWVG
jgi:hypothetical protein